MHDSVRVSEPSHKGNGSTGGCAGGGGTRLAHHDLRNVRSSGRLHNKQKGERNTWTMRARDRSATPGPSYRRDVPTSVGKPPASALCLHAATDRLHSTQHEQNL